MVTLLLAFSFLLLSWLGFAISKKIVNPLFIVPFLWGVLLFLFEVLPHNLYPLKEQFLESIFIWVISFFIGGVFFLNKKYSVRKTLFNKKVYNLYYYALLIFGPLALFTLVTEALKIGPQYFFLKLRMINTGADKNDTFSLGPLGYVFNFANVVCLLFTLYFEKIKKTRYYIVLLITVLLGLVTLARTSLVVLFIGIFCILYFKGVLRRKHYFLFGAVFIIFLILVTALRDSHLTEQENFAQTFSIYLFAGMPAFDTVRYIPSESFGSYTFRFFAAVGHSFGMKNIVQETILPYTNVPTLTNVYTVMFPFYKDFGYIGVCIFGTIYGSGSTCFFNGAKLGNNFFIILYAIILPCLLLQFFGEYIFQNLSTYLQLVFYILLPQFLRIKK